MELQTFVSIDRPEFQIDYRTRMMFLGSCFVENIGEQLDYFRFTVDVNPCGISYNPLSVADTLEWLWEGKPFDVSDLWQHHGLWGSFRHHGRFSAPTADECLRKINTRLEESAAHLRQADLLVITWGTAWVYTRREDGRVVSNCHKFPASDFLRRRLTVEEIVETYVPLLERLRGHLPQIRVLLTVSPIRHWKDGAHGNQLSKAVLLLAAERLVERLPFVSYFPSYEIVMDELRDYRFYADDLLHISPQGILYIWERFRDHYITREARATMAQVGKWKRILMHRPFEPDSEATLRLREQASEELRRLVRYPAWASASGLPK